VVKQIVSYSDTSENGSRLMRDRRVIPILLSLILIFAVMTIVANLSPNGGTTKQIGLINECKSKGGTMLPTNKCVPVIELEGDK